MRKERRDEKEERGGDEKGKLWVNHEGHMTHVNNIMGASPSRRHMCKHKIKFWCNAPGATCQYAIRDSRIQHTQPNARKNITTVVRVNSTEIILTTIPM